MYDVFSQDYDRFVSWPDRLAVELPFLESQLRLLAAGHDGLPRILDAACGTGMHAIALARHGYPTAGADLSAGMIARARQNAVQAGVDVQFETAGFGDLSRTFGAGAFGAILCLGNSLPHILDPATLAAALRDFAACLMPGGVLILQNRNFDAPQALQERWMEPQSHHEGDTEWVFLRFYDFEAGGLLNFNVVTLRRQGQGAWTQQVTSTRLRPLLKAELADHLASAGFSQVQTYGSLTGSEFNPTSSGNLVLTARRDSLVEPRLAGPAE